MNNMEPLEPRQRALKLVPHTDDVAKQHNIYFNDQNPMFGKAARVYYEDHKQKTEVMRAQDNRISTKHDDPRAVSIMLDLAESRGWDTLKLSGSQKFKQEAWIQARARGIEVEGYKPTQPDLQKADRLMDATRPTERLSEPATVREGPPAKIQDMTAEQAGLYIRQTNPQLFDEIREKVRNGERPEAVPTAHPTNSAITPTQQNQRQNERSLWNVVEKQGAAARGSEAPVQKQQAAQRAPAEAA